MISFIRKIYLKLFCFVVVFLFSPPLRFTLFPLSDNSKKKIEGEGYSDVE